MNSRLLIPVIAGLLSVGNAFCQNDPPGRWENVLEMLLSDEDLSQESRDEMSDMYESMHDSPLNINTATKEELAMLPFLDYGQIEDIHAYIYMHGPPSKGADRQPLQEHLDAALAEKTEVFI